jgi:HSP20 family protein
MRSGKPPGALGTGFTGLTVFGEPTLAWRPPADVYWDGHGWVVKFELAGVRREDVEYGVVGRRLTIRGKRCDWSVGESREAYSMEIDYSRFERTLELPCDAEIAQIVTEYRDGMFFVRLKTVARK